MNKQAPKAPAVNSGEISGRTDAEWRALQISPFLAWWEWLCFGFMLGMVFTAVLG